MSACGYCKKSKLKFYLECYNCNKKIHLECLKSKTVPSKLLGDIFYNFKCIACSPEEKFERQKMLWVDIMLLILYNLENDMDYKLQCDQGYFHFKKHIKYFIMTHWNKVFPHQKTKRKSLTSTILKTLKHNSQYFVSAEEMGSGFVNGSEWFRLRDSTLLSNHAWMERKRKSKRRLSSEYETDSNLSFDDSFNNYDSVCSSYNRNKLLNTQNNLQASKLFKFSLNGTSSDDNSNMYSKSYVKPSAVLTDCLFANDEDNGVDMDEDDVNEDIDIDVIDTDGIDMKFEDGLNVVNQLLKHHSPESPSNSQDSLSLDDLNLADKILSKSLFIRTPSSAHRFGEMNEKEQKYMLHSLNNKLSKKGYLSKDDNRLYKRLVILRWQKTKLFPILNNTCSKLISEEDEDNEVYEDDDCNGSEDGMTERRVLDRYTMSRHDTEQQTYSSFKSRLMGQSERPNYFVSPFTNRVLKPFIRRDYETEPLRLRLMSELEARINKNNPMWIPRKRAPIDYSYVKPHHFPAINSLAQQFFWPGIDLTESLQYPDFSCVVLYKKLIIGFAFLVPDVGANEAYISFIFTRPGWRGAGIATFMLYHLIQTCMGKDILLHVSPTNPATFLYQKFGFKIQEFIQDFYDRYLPMDSNECRHAILLRLGR